MVYAALRNDWLQQFLNTRALQYMRKLGFMLYLTHLAISKVVGDPVARAFGQVYTISEESWVNKLPYIPDIGPAGLSSRFLLGLMVTLPICLVVAEVGTKLLDIPSVRFGQWLVQRLGLYKASPLRKEADISTSIIPDSLLHTTIPSQKPHLLNLFGR